MKGQEDQLGESAMEQAVLRSCTESGCSEKSLLYAQALEVDSSLQDDPVLNLTISP